MESHKSGEGPPTHYSRLCLGLPLPGPFDFGPNQCGCPRHLLLAGVDPVRRPVFTVLFRALGHGNRLVFPMQSSSPIASRRYRRCSSSTRSPPCRTASGRRSGIGLRSKWTVCVMSSRRRRRTSWPTRPRRPIHGRARLGGGGIEQPDDSLRLGCFVNVILWMYDLTRWPKNSSA